MLLDEARLISSNGQIRAGVSLEPHQSEMIVCKSTNKAIKIKNVADTEAQIFHSGYLLTGIGKSLVPIAQNHSFQPPLDSYLVDCMNEIKENATSNDIFTSDNNKVSMEIVDL